MAVGSSSARLVGCALLLGAAFVTEEAAATPAAQLVYARGAGAETCPDTSALRGAVAERLGFDPFFPHAKQIVVAEIAVAAKGFRGAVRVLDESGQVRGERVLVSESQDCAEMMRSLALGISIAVDDLEVDVQTPAPAPPPATASQPREEVEVKEDRTPTATPIAVGRPRSSKERIAYDVRLDALGSVGAAPAVAFGGAVAVGARWRSLGTSLEGRFQPPVTSNLENGGAVWSSLATGTLAACWHSRLPFLCGLGSLGSFHGGGEEVSSPRSDSALFGAVGARLGVHVPITRAVYLQGHLETAYTLTPTRIVIGGREVFSASAFAGTLAFGAGALF